MKSRKLRFCSLRYFDRDMCLADLKTVPFGAIHIFEDVDDKLFVFQTLFTEVRNEHVPLKQFQVRSKQVLYMTEEWHKAIRYTNRPGKYSQRTGRIIIISYTQRNICAS